MKAYWHVAEVRHITVWVRRGKVQTFHCYSFRVMRLIILYSAVYQLRAAPPAHVNEITIPTYLSALAQHASTEFHWGQWMFLDSNSFGLTNRSGISAACERCSSFCVFWYLILPLLCPKSAPTPIEANVKPVATGCIALFNVLWCGIMQLFFTTWL